MTPVAATPSTSTLPTFAVQRLLTDRLLTSVVTAGLSRCLSTSGRVLPGDVVGRVGREFGYAVHDPVRARMIRVLLDLLLDCGFLRRCPDGTTEWVGDAVRPWVPAPNEAEEIQRAFAGQVEFFEQCLAYVERFLQGSPPLFDFSGGSTSAWEKLLGNGEFAFARSVLARLLLPRAIQGAQVLVLCYGPGYDLVEIERRRPDVRVTALDFTNAFFDAASGRLAAPHAVRWVDAGRWGGFGTSLPFPDASFDIVLFACADPYIPPSVRRLVYADMRRVLGPGGQLGLLTHSYPDPCRQAVAEPWIRRGTFCHDFLESVCQGWQGFYDAAETRALLAEVGLRPEVVTLNGSVWRLVSARSG